MAAIFAMKDGFKKANSILLEPIMKVENSTPEEYQGDIMGDLNRRRGKIMSIEAKNNLSIINAEVPLAEMFGYATGNSLPFQGAIQLLDGALSLRTGAGASARRGPGSKGQVNQHQYDRPTHSHSSKGI
jgi:hypothetical protein